MSSTASYAAASGPAAGRGLAPVQQAVALARRVGQVILATADDQGLPHVSIGACTHASGQELTVSEWFCPQTLRNLELNPRVAVVVWDPVSDTGYQMLGHVEAVNELHALGCADTPPAGAGTGEAPATEHALLIAVERVLDFSRLPHADRPMRMPAGSLVQPGAARGSVGPGAVRAVVDRAVCIGAASCVGIAPQYFTLDPDGLAHFGIDGAPPEDEELLREAAASCPVQAITLLDANGRPVGLEHHSGA